MKSALVFGFLFYSLSAFGTVKISSVDGASAVSSGTATIIYGGTAGSNASCSGTGLCNNCVMAATGAPDGMKACNMRRVTASTVFKVFFSSDAKDGKALVTNSDGSLAITSLPATTFTKGTAAYAQGTWGDVCNNSTPALTDCETDGGVDKNGALSVRIGIDGDSDNKLSSASDDYVTASFQIQRLMGNHVDTTSGSASAATNGIYNFSIYPGDGKVYLEDIAAWDGFPISANGTYYTKVHLLSKAVPGDACDATGIFGNVDVNPESGNDKTQDLESTEVRLADERFFGYENDAGFYMFKVALEDRAGNVGLFTKDSDCVAVTDGTGKDHVVQPGEVFGLLKEQQNCFISTAAFGSRMAPQVDIFRTFRDTFLVKTSLGRKFVSLYYDYSPKYAKMIAQSEPLRMTARLALYPFLGFAQLALKIGFLGATLVFGIFLFAVFGLWARLKKRASA